MGSIHVETFRSARLGESGKIEVIRPELHRSASY